MKKQIVIVGLVILLIFVGLSGCEQKGKSNLVSFQELTEHLSEYMGKTVTLEGYIAFTTPGLNDTFGVATMYDSALNPQYVVELSVPSTILLNTDMFRITGLVEDLPIGSGNPLVNVTSAEPMG